MVNKYQPTEIKSFCKRLGDLQLGESPASLHHREPGEGGKLLPTWDWENWHFWSVASMMGFVSFLSLVDLLLSLLKTATNAPAPAPHCWHGWDPVCQDDPGLGAGAQLGRRGQWGDTTLCTASAGRALQLHGPAWGHGAAKMGTWVRATPCVRLCEAGVMEPLQVGGIGCNKIKASMVKEGWRNLPSYCPQLVAAPSVPPQPHLAHPGMPLLGSLHGSCTVPGPGGSKELLAPAALGATWLPLLWVQRPPCRLPAATSQSPAGACGAPGAVMGASGKPLGASPNPRLPFHSAFNFI